MLTRMTLAGLVWLGGGTTPTAPAADLTKVDRSIKKEPAYQTKAPRYCLLVFGPRADYRVWLVLDGSTLYVDRNGNGDLTEAGQKDGQRESLGHRSVPPGVRRRGAGFWAEAGRSSRPRSSAVRSSASAALIANRAVRWL